MNIFQTLSAIDVSSKVEKKGNLTYLSWAWAWAEACKVCKPIRTVHKDGNGNNYHTDGKTAWVEVGVTIDEVEHIEYLPIMNNNNKSMPLNNITSWDVNKSIQRATVKALALHGLGLNVYAGEDLPITASLPILSEVAKWIGNGETKEACILHITNNLGCTITEEYRKQIMEL